MRPGWAMGPVLKEGQKKSWEGGTPGGGRFGNVMAHHTCVWGGPDITVQCHGMPHLCVCVGGCPEITVQCQGTSHTCVGGVLRLLSIYNYNLSWGWCNSHRTSALPFWSLSQYSSEIPERGARNTSPWGRYTRAKCFRKGMEKLIRSMSPSHMDTWMGSHFH